MTQQGELVDTGLHPGLSPRPATRLTWLLVFNLIGLALIVVGWYQTSGAGSISNQLKWLNLAVAGLVVAGTGNCLWLLRGRQDVVMARMVVARPGPGFFRRVETLARTNGESEVLLVSGPRMTRYHRSDCLLMANKEARIASRPRHERDGFRPCEVCEP